MLCVMLRMVRGVHPAAAVMAVLTASPLSKVLVGDPHQQIYGFRGARDSMQLTREPASRTFYLTKVG